ncbi:MAG: hypothetical protein LC739_07470 [Actinobacteria bacterium]|nr:hypothetical protein [Actinomycetota bacterium]
MTKKTTLVGRLAAEAGRGVVAGLIGTAAMTLSSTIEKTIRKRPASTVPSEVGGRLLGVKPRDSEGKARFSNVMHWQYGSSLGLLRAALGTALREPWAGAAFFGLVWAGELVLVPRLSQQTPPATQWGPSEVAIDGWHHLVYAAATSLAFTTLVRARYKK